MGRMLLGLESRSCGLPGLSKILRALAIHQPDVRLVSRCGLIIKLAIWVIYRMIQAVNPGSFVCQTDLKTS